jgi:hypothetical protein
MIQSSERMRVSMEALLACLNVAFSVPRSWLRHYATNWKVAGSSPG